jgi:hypothetical protein
VKIIKKELFNLEIDKDDLELIDNILWKWARGNRDDERIDDVKRIQKMMDEALKE